MHPRMAGPSTCFPNYVLTQPTLSSLGSQRAWGWGYEIVKKAEGKEKPPTISPIPITTCFLLVCNKSFFLLHVPSPPSPHLVILCCLCLLSNWETVSFSKLRVPNSIWKKFLLLDIWPDFWTESQRGPESPSPASACSDGPVLNGHRAPAEGRVKQSQRDWMEISKGQLP